MWLDKSWSSWSRRSRIEGHSIARREGPYPATDWPAALHPPPSFLSFSDPSANCTALTGWLGLIPRSRSPGSSQASLTRTTRASRPTRWTSCCRLRVYPCPSRSPPSLSAHSRPRRAGRRTSASWTWSRRCKRRSCRRWVANKARASVGVAGGLRLWGRCLR